MGLYGSLNHVVQVMCECVGNFGVLEAEEEVQCFGTQALHLLLCILHSAVTDGEIHQFLNLQARGFASPHAEGDVVEVGIGAGVEGEEHGQGELAFLHIVALGFAHVETLIEVEDVITHLETESHEVSESL